MNDTEPIGPRLLKSACEPVPKDWEVSRHGVFDCFGIKRRALSELQRQVSRWEDEGGAIDDHET